MRRTVWFLAVALLLAWWPTAGPATAGQDMSGRARQLYNAGRFEEAIARAEQDVTDPKQRVAAALILSRARLERYRAGRDPKDLADARVDLLRLDPTKLSTEDRVEWQIGVAETLFLEGQPGPAAELFGNLFEAVRQRPYDQARLLDWWATALERQAEPRPRNERTAIYRRIIERMEDELDRNPLSPAALYWLPAAVRGAGDLDRAWNAAVASWVRTEGLDGEASLREDLDRLMLQGIIPERARQRTRQPLDAEATIGEMASMADEWEGIKRRWTAGS